MDNQRVFYVYRKCILAIATTNVELHPPKRMGNTVPKLPRPFELQ